MLSHSFEFPTPYQSAFSTHDPAICAYITWETAVDGSGNYCYWVLATHMGDLNGLLAPDFSPASFSWHLKDGSVLLPFK